MKELDSLSIEELLLKIKECDKFLNNYTIDLQDENRQLRSILRKTLFLFLEKRWIMLFF